MKPVMIVAYWKERFADERSRLATKRRLASSGGGCGNASGRMGKGTGTILILVIPPSGLGGVMIVQPAAAENEANNRTHRSDRVFIVPPSFPCPSLRSSFRSWRFPFGAPAGRGRAASVAERRTARGGPPLSRAASRR